MAHPPAEIAIRVIVGPAHAHYVEDTLILGGSGPETFAALQDVVLREYSRDGPQGMLVCVWGASPIELTQPALAIYLLDCRARAKTPTFAVHGACVCSRGERR